MTSPTELPFDVYQRYRLVADVLDRLRAAAGPDRGRPFKVLDVGGRTAVLRGFDSEDAIVLVDVEPLEDADDLVLGDGCKLPFADASFDVVCALDTLEHVPPDRREAFVDECARVAGRWVVLAGPYDGERIVEAERALRSFLQQKLELEHRYLDEHQRHGLPDRAAVEQRLAGHGAEVLSLGHANLERWLILMCLSFYLDHDPTLRPLARSFFRFYNGSLYASDHAAPVYRHAVIAAMNGAPLPDLEGLLAPPRAPEGAVQPFVRLAEELLVFDRERDAWEVERGRLRETIATLAADLAEHGKVIAARDAQVAEQGEHIGQLEAHLRDRNAELKRKPMALLRRVMWLFFGKPPTA